MQQPQSTPTPAPVQVAAGSQQAQSSGSGDANTAAIWQALENAQKAIQDLQKQKDEAFQAGLDKAAEIFKAGQSTGGK